MAWQQLSTEVEEAIAEELSDFLMDLGAVSVTFSETGREEIFEPEIGTTPIWEITKVIALFEDDMDINQIVDTIYQQFPQIQNSQIEDADEDSFNQINTEQIEDRDWIREWMDQYEPLQFGENLWIVPSWLQPPNPDAVNLMLDPGLAFGTGTHPTTALCLSWLSDNPPVGKSVIDYGCGSGILAIAAKKLGANHVSGTDIDPQAIIASNENAERNQVSIDFALVEDFPARSVSLLIANILAGPLKELATEFQKLLKPEATLVISGILSSQVDDLISHYQHLGFKHVETKMLEEWALVEFSYL